jgi:hypothetical protein
MGYLPCHILTCLYAVKPMRGFPTGKKKPANAG